MPQEVIVFGPEWARVKAELRKAQTSIPHKLDDEIEQLAEKYADKARRKVMSLPTPRNAGHTGLRARVAAGVHVVNTPGAGVRVTTSMARPDERIIPLGLDRKEGWRHPLFGDKNHWFRNPGYSWFRETFSDAQGDFEKHLTNVLENAAHEIAGH